MLPIPKRDLLVRRGSVSSVKRFVFGDELLVYRKSPKDFSYSAIASHYRDLRIKRVKIEANDKRLVRDMNNDPTKVDSQRVEVPVKEESSDKITSDKITSDIDTESVMTNIIIDESVSEVVASETGEHAIKHDCGGECKSGCGCKPLDSIGSFAGKNPPNAAVWKSGITLVNKVELSIPGIILIVCNYLREHTRNNEFSILCKGIWDGGKYCVSDDYVIPKQKVDSTSVYYDDANLHELRALGYNVVIHCHPFKSSSFSGTDMDTINAHFECSILYSEQEFTTAIIPVQLNSDVTLQLKPESIAVNWKNMGTIIPEAEISSRIEYITKSYGYGGNYNKYYDNYYNGTGKGNNKKYGSKTNTTYTSDKPQNGVNGYYDAHGIFHYYVDSKKTSKIENDFVAEHDGELYTFEEIGTMMDLTKPVLFYDNRGYKRYLHVENLPKHVMFSPQELAFYDPALFEDEDDYVQYA